MMPSSGRRVLPFANLFNPRVFSVFLLCAMLAVSAFSFSAAYAQPKDKPMDVDAVLSTARAQIDKIQKTLAAQSDKPSADKELVDLRTAALDAQSQAEQVATAIEPQVVAVQARVAELGEPSADTPDTPDVAVQRAQLSKSSSTLNAQLKLARLIAVEAGQAAEKVLKLRRSQFQAQLGERAALILAPDFWDELNHEWPRDKSRLTPLLEELAQTGAEVTPQVWLLLVAGIAVLLGIWVFARRVLVRLTATRIAPGRLRRSLYAVALVLLAAVIPGLIAQLLRTGISWDRDLGEATAELLKGAVGIIIFGGFLAGLGHALLQPNRPTWRLIEIPDLMARGLRWFPLVVAIVVVAGWIFQRLATLLNASLAITVAFDCVTTLVLGAVLALAMRRGRTLRRRIVQSSADQPAVQALPLWLAALFSLSWLALLVGMGSVLIGYIALGSFVIKQLLWAAVILGSTYLVTGLIGDVCNSVLASIKRNAAQAGDMSTMTRARSQIMVLLSGFSRLIVIAFALMLLLVPFGEGPTEWWRQFEHLYSGIPIGEVQIRPTSVLLAFFVLLGGFAAVKIMQRWLATQYLPTTSLDSGMRLSAATLFGYGGYVVAVALAMSAVGVGLERVAWVASALSVGIGFGLQAVVQNFVSGLILLAERPVKVGDWVALGGIEGDIRRINVRATEIQMGDRSTVIVPNSEFITKIVRNVTHANPLGRVQFSLTLPLLADADVVRGLLFSALADNADVLDEPAPNVLLDRIEHAGLVFSATGYVSSPRVTGGIRSALLFDILKRLREADISLSEPSSALLADKPQLNVPATTAAAPPLSG